MNTSQWPTLLRRPAIYSSILNHGECETWRSYDISRAPSWTAPPSRESFFSYEGVILACSITTSLIPNHRTVPQLQDHHSSQLCTCGWPFWVVFYVPLSYFNEDIDQLFLSLSISNSRARISTWRIRGRQSIFPNSPQPSINPFCPMGGMISRSLPLPCSRHPTTSYYRATRR